MEAHGALLWWLLVASGLMFVASVVAVPWMLVRIPSNYFGPGQHHSIPFADRHPVVRVVLLAVRNLLGVLLIAAGIAMLVLPGQGVLTILAGLVLLHFPHKHELLRWIVSRRAVLVSANWVRHRAGRPPLVV
ncbi:MAG: PGPGW domain-containing protein [Gemmatimonadaceae bacterium]